MIGEKARLVLLAPLLLFAFSVWLHVDGRAPAGSQLDRAQDQWRLGNYEEAADLLREVYRVHPRSRFAAEALSELGTLYYVNFYDVSRAVHYFERLVREFPDSPHAASALQRLGEIHEVELGDSETAIGWWEVALRHPLDRSEAESVRFRISTALLRLERIDEALEGFRRLTEEAEDFHILEQSLVRTGSLLQIKEQYEASIPYFQRALRQTDCVDCRLQAQLGLIDSYQFTDDLRKAIEVARALDPDHYPGEMREELLQSLDEKSRHFHLGGWTFR